MQVNRQVVTDVLKEQDPDKSGVIPTQQFTSSLEGIGIPLQSEEFEKLIRVYDKKGEGKLNYDDFLTEQKYIHAVSINTLNLGNSITMQECTCLWNILYEWFDENRPGLVHIIIPGGMWSSQGYVCSRYCSPVGGTIDLMIVPAL